MPSPTDRVVARRLRRLTVEEQGVFSLVASDHRQNLRKKLPDLDEEEAEAVMRRVKVAVARTVGPHSSGCLTDPQYGLPAILDSDDVAARTPLVVALEQTGYGGPRTERRLRLVEGFSADAALRADATACKLLVYYHPRATSASDKRQQIADVAEMCAAAGLPLFVEPLVFDPETGERPEPGVAGFAEAVCETAADLSDLGATVLKVEFPGDPSTPGEWEAACRRLDASVSVPWVVLGGTVAFDTFLQQAEVACRSGASGVMVGRAIWGEVLRMDDEAQRAFLADTAAARMDRVTRTVVQHARPFWDR